MKETDVPTNDSASTLRKETDGVIYEPIHIAGDKGTNATRSSSIDEKRAQTAETEVSGHGVNISRAEAEFAELNRELSKASHLSRVQSRQSRKVVVNTDVEKAFEDGASEEQFDLESVLRGNRDEEERAGIKSKKIGVMFEDLTVSGIGGVKSKSNQMLSISNVS